MIVADGAAAVSVADAAARVRVAVGAVAVSVADAAARVRVAVGAVTVMCAHPTPSVPAAVSVPAVAVRVYFEARKPSAVARAELSVATAAVLAKRGIVPDLVAGHSLGEYSALAAAEALSLSDTARLLRLARALTSS